MDKLGIVIPYRNRKKHLDVFISYMREFLKSKGLSNYRFFVVEQDDHNPFNRGLLLNCGFVEAKKFKCTRVCFHDVDLLPLESEEYTAFPEEPTQLVRQIKDSTEPLPYNYFGGVVQVSAKDFEEVDGYSNNYEGWGFEDDDFLLRCQNAGVGLWHKTYPLPRTSGKAAIFSEHRVITRDVELRKGMTILVADFIPEYPTENVGIQDMNVVSLRDPLTGQETSISYDQFNCYRASVWDKNWNTFSVISGKAPLLHSRCVLAIDRAKQSYSFYWNGNCLGKYQLRSSEICLIRGKEAQLVVGKNFRGKILEAGCFIVQRNLEDPELEQLSLTQIDPILQYDARISEFFYADSGEGWISEKTSEEISIPCLAPIGLYQALGHKGNNVVVDGHYLPEIRKNQDRFYRTTRGEFKDPDGLSTLDQWSRDVSIPEPDITWIKVTKK